MIKNAVLLANGRIIDLDEVTLSLNDLSAIAHALSKICRFGGHTQLHYSVAQHSMLVSTLVPPEYRLEALLHDAHEALIGDICTNVKNVIGRANIGALEQSIDQAIRDMFQGALKSKGRLSDIPAVKAADYKALQYEAYLMFPQASAETLHTYFGVLPEEEIELALKNAYLTKPLPAIDQKWVDAVMYEYQCRLMNPSDKLVEGCDATSV